MMKTNKSIVLLVLLTAIVIHSKPSFSLGGIDGGGGGISQIISAYHNHKNEMEVRKSFQFQDILRDLKNSNIARDIPEVDAVQFEKIVNSVDVQIVKKPRWQKDKAPFLVAFSFPDRNLIEVDWNQLYSDVTLIADTIERRMILRALGFHEIARHLGIEMGEDDYSVTSKYFHALKREKNVMCKYEFRDDFLSNLTDGETCLSSLGVVWEKYTIPNIGETVLDVTARLVWYPEFTSAVTMFEAGVHCDNKGLRLPSASELLNADKRGLREVLHGLQYNTDKYFWSHSVSSGTLYKAYRFGSYSTLASSYDANSNPPKFRTFCVKSL